MDLQAETIRKKVNLDETTHQKEVDHKLLMKELQITKRNAKESQARANALAHENSKLLHEISINLQRAEKAERRCVELAGKQSNEQIRVTELEYLNTQLQSQLEEYQIDGCKTTQRIKQTLEDLREQHRKDEQRRTLAQSILRKCCSVLGPVRGTSIASTTTSPATGTRHINFNQEIFKQQRQINMNISKSNQILELRNAIEQISKLLGDSPNDEDASSSILANDCEGMVVRICAIGESQSQQNLELKNQLSDCREELQKERDRNESVLNRYKESLEKVKKSSQTLKQSLLDMQQVHKLEKEQLDQKMKDQIKELIRQKDSTNKTLNNADKTIDSLEKKVAKLKELNQQLLQEKILAEKSASKAKQSTRLLVQEINYLKQRDNNNNNNESSNYGEREELDRKSLDNNEGEDSEDIQSSQRSSSDVNGSRQSHNRKSQYSYECSNNASQKFNQDNESDNENDQDNESNGDNDDDDDDDSQSHDPNELMTFANTELSNSNHWEKKSKQSHQRQIEGQQQQYQSYPNSKKYISSSHNTKSQMTNNQNKYAMFLNSNHQHNLKGNAQEDGITNYYSFARRTTKQDEDQSVGSVSQVIEQEITELDDEINQIKMSLAHELIAIDSSKQS